MSNLQTWDFIDKSEYGEGVWQNEPDKAQWIDNETGLHCLMVRGHHGALCGYVGVGESHKLFGKDYSICSESCGEQFCDHAPGAFLEAHGGITYSNFCREENTEHGICHIGEDKVFWFGFDCAHSGDACPAYSKLSLLFFVKENYRDFEYVQNECASLARQLAQLSN